MEHGSGAFTDVASSGLRSSLSWLFGVSKAGTVLTVSSILAGPNTGLARAGGSRHLLILTLWLEASL